MVLKSHSSFPMLIVEVKLAINVKKKKEYSNELLNNNKD